MSATTAAISNEAIERLEAFLAHHRRQRTVCESVDGRPAEVSEQGGGSCLYEYNAAGDLTEITEADGIRVSFAYDERRRLLRASDERGETTTYLYGDNNKLREIERGGVREQFEYDAAGRLTTARRGNAGASVYLYDEQGRVTTAQSAHCTTEHDYDAASGRVVAIRQTLDGVTIALQLSYDEAGRLAAIALPGSSEPIRYEWDERGRPAAIHLGARPFASFKYEDRKRAEQREHAETLKLTETRQLAEKQERAVEVHYASGVVERSFHDATGGRLLRQEVVRGDALLARRTNQYDAGGQLRADGHRRYEYDALGRLARATAASNGESWAYEYDACDNIVTANERRFVHDRRGQLLYVESDEGNGCELSHDRWGRLTGKCSTAGEQVYRYDDAGQLTEVLRDGEVVARFTYDYKGRLVAMKTRHAEHACETTERYLYGAGDELFAITDESGQPRRIFIRTLFGCVGEIDGAVESGAVFSFHADERGVCYLVCDERGDVVSRPRVSPFGAPLAREAESAPVTFCGRRWFANVELYYFGARWYDPALGRFLTPDSFTARPDDARIVNALNDAGEQSQLCESLLQSWLKHPRLRNRYAYCGNDPVNCVDPNGHWSVGYVLLSLLGVIWTLPNTLFGLLVEITCLVGEVIRWIVYALTWGHVSWQTPGFDAAASGRLNAYALVFEGGWLGSFSSLLGITFGNVFFVYKEWRTHPAIVNLGDAEGNVSPAPYNGTVKFPRDEALYEHELRHTNQYQWLGPFFHLGLPLWGAYEWEVMLNGYEMAWMEVDARNYGGF